ncbi:MAG: GTPase HflX, partial [Candidatus Theseobacter exili]|nr:GTPase HflX [Candidatus Theseobacter exili]
MLIERKKHLREKAILVGLEWGRPTSGRRWDLDESLSELESLTKTAGAEVAEHFSVFRKAPNPATFIGKGKVEELKILLDSHKANLVIFDDELTPAQYRNLTENLGVRVVDRSQLILDIFASRSRTKESKLEIELVQLQYLLPRLTGLWQHLSRQEGGVGTRGPGEKQLEVDRRRVRDRISRLKKALKGISSYRKVQRQKRLRRAVPLVSLIGYTNAGKTSLFNSLTESRNKIENKLFATLDPTIRKWKFAGDVPLLIADTVGFIRKLPHHLVESFKGTLEEASWSDLIINVVDLSDPMMDEKNEIVYQVLDELGALHKPIIMVLNKIDLVPNYKELINRFSKYNYPVVPVSSKTFEGLNGLLETIKHVLSKQKE